MSGDEPHRSRDARGSGRCRAPADAPPASCQTLPEVSCAVSVQRAAAEHGEFLNGQKALRTGAGAIHQECLMHSRFSAPQAQCLWHFACPVRRAFCPLRISIRVRKCPPHRHRAGRLRERLAGCGRSASGCAASAGFPGRPGSGGVLVDGSVRKGSGTEFQKFLIKCNASFFSLLYSLRFIF